MNKFVTTALAVAAAGSVSSADPGDSDWLELDSEMTSLASSLTSDNHGMGWTALLRTYYVHSSDDIATGGGPDQSGFGFVDVDFALWGSVADYGWRVSADLESGSLSLEDAYAFWACGEYFTAMFGQFKPQVLRSGFIDPENQLFINRTAMGSQFDLWNLGIGADGFWEQFNWWVSIHNGSNGSTSDHLYALRVEWSLGTGAGDFEGAMGGSDELNATFGLSLVNDDSVDGPPQDPDNSRIYLDANGNFGQFGFGVEIGMFDDDAGGTVGTDYMLPLAFEGDSDPLNVTLSFLLNPEWEFGLRYEDLDNGTTGADNTVLSLVANWFQSGNNAKWQAQWSDVDADTGNPDGSVFMVSLVVGATR
jgi:hypothetical protein